MPTSTKQLAGGWVMSEQRCKKARFVFAVSRGIVREVYEVEKWRQRRKGDRDAQDDKGRRPRWGFDGHRAGAELDKYRNTSVRHLIGKGSADPVRYINCD